jgi:hypothetical protein
MTDPSAQRTLVKSPPELWAEVSNQDALARRLGEFGEIRITRTEPETTVAWEGERARGTVELKASGWGTKVTLTAEATAPEPSDLVVEEVAAPVAASARAAAPLPAAPAPAPAAAQPAAASPAAPAPAFRPATRHRPGLLARFRRRPRAARPPAVESSFLHAQGAIATTRRDPVLSAPVAPALSPPEPPPSSPVPASRPDPEAVEAVLIGVLDDLGSARKRPFSR